MTIQRAIKSGKPFRRKVWSKKDRLTWFVARKPRAKYRIWDYRYLLTNLTSKGAKSLVRDILATDWEIKLERGQG